jgi:hypothetical protein
MPLTKLEFETLKSHQFCYNPACEMYGLVGQGNIKTHSFASEQGYYNCCKGKPFSIMWFPKKSPRCTSFPYHVPS